MASEFRARNVAEAGAMLLHPDEVDPLLQFQGLSRLLSGYLRPDDTQLPADIELLLLRSLENPDIDVRSLAAASLHWTRGEDPDVRARLVEAVRTAESDEAFRGRWMLALGFLGDRARDQGDFQTSASAYRKALELSPENARVLNAVGQMRSRAGEYPAAIEAIRRSLAVDPRQPLGWVNLGIALAGSGDPLGARDAYAEALALNPHEALAHFNLGNSYQQAERYEDAVAAYTRAIESDPGLGLGHFELARTYIRLERFREALPHARRAAEFLPENANARQMLADLERAFAGPPVP
jgi:tetratricopeptide (TPR) repeat protein